MRHSPEPRPSRLERATCLRFVAPLVVAHLACCAGPQGTPPDAATDLSVDAPPSAAPVFPAVNMNQLLGDREKTWRGDGARLILGSTGARLFALSLRPQLGLVGELNYIHEDTLGGSNMRRMASTFFIRISAAIKSSSAS